MKKFKLISCQTVKTVDIVGAQAAGMTAALRGLSSKANSMRELHKESTGAGVSALRATTHRRVQEMGYKCRIPSVKPLLNQRLQKCPTWLLGLPRLLLSGPKSSFQKEVNLAFHLEIKVPV